MSLPDPVEHIAPSLSSTAILAAQLRQLAAAVEENDPQAELALWLQDRGGGSLWRSIPRRIDDRLEALATYLGDEQVATMARAGGRTWTIDQVRLIAVRQALASIVPPILGLDALPASSLLATRALIDAELARREAEEGYLPEPEVEERILAAVYGAQAPDALARPVETGGQKRTVRFCPPAGADLVFVLAEDGIELLEPPRPLSYSRGDPEVEERARETAARMTLDTSGQDGRPRPRAGSGSRAERALSLLPDESTEADW